MSGKSELFSPLQSTSADRDPRGLRGGLFKHRRSLLEIALVFGLILVAVWTPQGALNSLIAIVAAACVVGFAISGKWTPSQLGLTRPLAGAAYMLTAGALLCLAIMLIGISLRFAGAGYSVPWSRSWQYAIWSLAQEFILQSIFFVRLESILGARQGVIAAASLFAVAHLPSPVLTLLAFVGAVVFSGFFRHWRNLFPLGLIHAALGLTIAASLPDKWLHHMRVGIGYLTIHP